MVFSQLMYKLYGMKGSIIKKFVRRMVERFEGGEVYSQTLRDIFRGYHQVEIGMYTMGGCFVPGQVDRFTTIGRYSSMARKVRINNRNHPIEFKSTHAFFFNPHFKFCESDSLDYVPLAIGNDVWIGHNAIINPGVRTIGNGAIIGAGAVVSINVPPYAVVVGNPARVVRYRFSKDVIKELLASRWWEKSIDEIKPYIREFQGPYGTDRTGSHLMGSPG